MKELIRFDWDPKYTEFYTDAVGYMRLFAWVKHALDGEVVVKVYRCRERNFASFDEAVAYINEKLASFIVTKKLGC